MDYIEERLAQPITLRRLAELANVSPRHFERAFRQALGIPPHAYVMRKRVAAAQHLLLSEPKLGIEEIAARSGSAVAAIWRRLFAVKPDTRPRDFDGSRVNFAVRSYQKGFDAVRSPRSSQTRSFDSLLIQSKIVPTINSQTDVLIR